MAVTPSGFCAVRQVMAVVPKTPWAAKVSRSAWMPAPAPLSEPAMVRATGSSAVVMSRSPTGRIPIIEPILSPGQLVENFSSNLP